MVDSGVPQGSVLGPILFLIYVDDAARDLDCEVAMFADDMKIWSVIRGPADEDRLQVHLNRLEEWSNRWLLRFNVAKCSILRLGNTARSASTRDYFLGGAALQEVEAQKDLGVLTTSSLKPSAHCSRVAKTAMSVLGAPYNTAEMSKHMSLDFFANAEYNKLNNFYKDNSALLARINYREALLHSLLPRQNQRWKLTQTDLCRNLITENSEICSSSVEPLQVNDMDSNGDFCIEIYEAIHKLQISGEEISANASSIAESLQTVFLSTQESGEHRRKSLWQGQQILNLLGFSPSRHCDDRTIRGVSCDSANSVLGFKDRQDQSATSVLPSVTSMEKHPQKPGEDGREITKNSFLVYGDAMRSPRVPHRLRTTLASSFESIYDAVLDQSSLPPASKKSDGFLIKKTSPLS
nr:unnamed protein product [Spirometra erinaceieuropaei]